MSTTIKCPICEKECKQLTAQHIFKHNLTIEEFKNKYPTTYLGNPDAEIIKKEKRLDQYQLDNIRCKQCNELITTPNRKKRRFCSKQCSAKYYGERKSIDNRRTRGKKICLSCNKEYDCVHTAQQFCDNKCQQDYKYKQNIQNWKDSTAQGHSFKIQSYIRKYLFEKYNHQCCKCGWNKLNPTTGKIPLEVEHIDGNSNNNKEENLELLCPCCHALTPTYKGANRGNGRHNRRKRYQEGKSY